MSNSISLQIAVYRKLGRVRCHTPAAYFTGSGKYKARGFSAPFRGGGRIWQYYHGEGGGKESNFHR
jgi:hypothetical protein